MRKRAVMPLVASIVASFSLFATLELAVVSGASAELAPTRSPSNGANLVVDVPVAPENLLPTSVVMSEGRAVGGTRLFDLFNHLRDHQHIHRSNGAALAHNY